MAESLVTNSDTEKKTEDAEKEQEEKKEENFQVEYPETYKIVPLCIMLIAGLAVGIATYIVGYELIPWLWTMAIVLFVFYIIGTRIKKIIEKFWYDNSYNEFLENQNNQVSDEGEVIEKEANPEEEPEADV